MFNDKLNIRVHGRFVHPNQVGFNVSVNFWQVVGMHEHITARNIDLIFKCHCNSLRGIGIFLGTIIADDLFNDGGESRETLWGCPSCHKCEERCPYEFNPLVLVKAHKEAAFTQGLAPKEVYAELETIINTGSAFPLSSMTERQRDKLGLPPLPEYPVDDLAIIARHTGLAERLAAVREMQKADEENNE